MASSLAGGWRQPACTRDQVLADIAAGLCQFVEFQFTDVSGTLKGVVLPVGQVAETLDFGHWFDGSSLEAGARTIETDLLLWPDVRTWSIVPWAGRSSEGGKTSDGLARVLCDIRTPDGEAYPADPRSVLSRAVAEAHDAGFEMYVASELEFFLFQSMPDGSRTPSDRAGYFDLASDTGVRVREEIVRHLQHMGIAIESSHHEIAPGQHEIDLPMTPVMTAADAVVTVKYAVKSVARRRGLAATFMPKPVAGAAGSGLHFHQSLRGPDGADLFGDAVDEHGLSEIARGWIGGQLAHARASAAVLAPQVNSYKRLGRGFDAPSMIAWSHRATDAMLRVGRPHSGLRASGSRRPMIIELRCPDPSCNPYLALAVMIAAGLDGVRNKLDAPPPMSTSDEQHSASMLPVSLGEALTELAWDGVVREALGPHVHDRLMTASEIEWQTYKSQVTEWELGRAFDAS